MRTLFCSILAVLTLHVPAHGQTVQITSVFGRANVRRGESVPMGVTIRTGRGGSVSGKYPPQGMSFQQNPDSSIALSSSGQCRSGGQAGRVTEWEISGIVFLQFPKRFFVRCSRAAIRTPQATYRIGGTDLRLSNDGNEKTILAVREGKVSVSSLNKEVWVPEGYWNQVLPGEYPGMPQPYDKTLRYDVLQVLAGRALIRTADSNEIYVGDRNYGRRGWIPLWARAEIRNVAGDTRSFVVRP